MRFFILPVPVLEWFRRSVLYVGDGGNSELIASAEVGMTAVLTSQFLKDSAPHLVEERKNTVNHHILHLKDILPLIKTLEG